MANVTAGSPLILGPPPIVEMPSAVDLFGIAIILVFVGLLAIGIVVRIQNNIRAPRSQDAESREGKNSA